MDYLQRGMQLYELQRYADAREEFHKVLLNRPSFSAVLYMISICYTLEKKYSDGLIFANRSLEFNPESAMNHYAQGLASAGMEEYDSAIISFENAIELDPDNDDFHAQLALTYLQKQILGKAELHINKALEINPNNIMALGLKSHYENLFSRGDSAKSLLDKALEVDPTNVGLLFEKGIQDTNTGEYGSASEMFEQVLQDDPGDSLIRERILDTKLGQYKWYEWLVLKFRAFSQASYLVIIFDIGIVLVGGAILREKNIEEPYYPIAKYIVIALTIWNLIFWVGRMIGHIYMSRKLWKLRFKDLGSLSIFIHVNMTLALLSFLIHIHTLNFLWLGTAIMLMIFSLLSLGITIIEEAKKNQYFKYYLIFIYGLGVVNFITQFFELDISATLANAQVASIFVPAVLFGLYDSFIENKKEKNKPKPIKEKEVEKTSLLEKVNQWIMLPVMFGCFVLSIFYGNNILEKPKFTVIWGIISIGIAFFIYLQMKKRNSSILNIKSNSESMEDRFGGIARFFLTIIFLVVSLGIGGTHLIDDGKRKIVEVPIVEHGLKKEKTNRIVVIRYKNWRSSLAFTKEQLEKTKDCETVKLEISESLFGVDYYRNVIPCK